jgi:DNA-binding response OmpR family regulator
MKKKATKFSSELESEEWSIEAESRDGARAFKRIKDSHSDAVVVVLDKLPSHGIETALVVRNSKSTAGISIVFVDAEEDTLKQVRALSLMIYFAHRRTLNPCLTPDLFRFP